MIKYLYMFIAIFFTGDEVMFLLSFMSAQNYYNVFAIFIIAIMANTFSDCFFYFFGNKFIRGFKFMNRYKKLTNTLFEKTKSQNTALFLSKFIYGTRILTVTTLGFKKMNFFKFLLIDILALIPITTAIISLGWLAGNGTNYINLYTPALFIFSIILLIIFRKCINKKLQQSYLLIKKKKE